MEPAPEDVAVDRIAERGGLERTDERVVAPGALVVAVAEPGGEIGCARGRRAAGLLIFCSRRLAVIPLRRETFQAIEGLPSGSEKRNPFSETGCSAKISASRIGLDVLRKRPRWGVKPAGPQSDGGCHAHLTSSSCVTLPAISVLPPQRDPRGATVWHSQFGVCETGHTGEQTNNRQPRVRCMSSFSE